MIVYCTSTVSLNNLDLLSLRKWYTDDRELILSAWKIIIQYF